MNRPGACVVFASMHSFQIELRWQDEQSELAVQSPRVSEGEARQKLRLLATLAYAFLLTLLHASLPLTLRLAGVLLSLARPRQAEKRSICALTCCSQDGQARDGRQIERVLRATNRWLPV